MDDSFFLSAQVFMISYFGSTQTVWMFCATVASFRAAIFNAPITALGESWQMF
jgi:hypothetical protein